MMYIIYHIHILYNIHYIHICQADNKESELPKDRKYFKYSKISDLVQHFPMKKSLTPEVCVCVCVCVFVCIIHI